MKIYLVGPISGSTQEKVMESIESRKRVFENAGYHVLHPMIGKDQLRVELKYKAKDYRYPVATNHAIFTRDLWMVKMADIVLADFTGSSHVSIGSMFELAWASYLNKHVIVVMDDKNIHQHAFVVEAASIVFDNMKDAYEYLKTLIGKEDSNGYKPEKIVRNAKIIQTKQAMDWKTLEGTEYIEDDGKTSMRCPLCETGYVKYRINRKSSPPKLFLGCSEYYSSGCTYTLPVNQETYRVSRVNEEVYS